VDRTSPASRRRLHVRLRIKVVITAYSLYDVIMRKRKPTSWSAEDRQLFADRNILKAQRIPDKRKAINRQACRGFSPAFGEA
jgi:hypothetical protein